MNESIDCSDGDGASEMCVCNRQREIGVAPGNYRSENRAQVTSAGVVVYPLCPAKACALCSLRSIHTQGPVGGTLDGDGGKERSQVQERKARVRLPLLPYATKYVGS